MQVVLMAAGFGSRLGALTERIPKALVSVGAEPLVAHAIRFAGRLSPSEIIVVGGVGFPLVQKELADRRLDVTLVENKEYKDGNLLSLFAARPRIAGDFLLMNVDHIYRPAIAEIVRRPVEDVTGFIDTDRKLGADDMKVARDAHGRIEKIAKTLTTWDAGYVGMTRVPQAALERYWRTADATLAADGRAVHVERVLARLAEDPTTRPRCADISGHGWLEVDTPDERTHAEEALRGGGWR
jgi:choline kinase